MSAIFHPSRGGVRGGRDQFDWEDVKTDKDRECYLGHSLKAPVGRWQKGKDLQWYTRDKNSAEVSRKAEIEAVKQAEREMMAAALGHKPPPKRRPSEQLSKQDMKRLLRGDEEETTEAENADKMKGLGFTSQRLAMVSGGAMMERKEGESETGQPSGMLRRPSEASTSDTCGLGASDSSKKKKKREKKEKKEKKRKKEKKQTERDESRRRNRHDSENSHGDDERQRHVGHVKGSDNSIRRRSSPSKDQYSWDVSKRSRSPRRHLYDDRSHWKRQQLDWHSEPDSRHAKRRCDDDFLRRQEKHYHGDRYDRHRRSPHRHCSSSPERDRRRRHHDDR